jgi:RNA polymerase sigma factor (sigma-70 family)
MPEGKLSLPWSGADDRTFVRKMLTDLQAEQWYECREFVKKHIPMQANNIPQDHWDDIIQDTMIKIQRSLPTFQYHCTLKTWIVGIIRSCVIDDYRKTMRTGPLVALPGDAHDGSEREGEALRNNHALSVEEECILHEELDKATVFLRAYLSTHANQERNTRILDMVLNEGRSLEDVAKTLGCSAPVAGYIVRSAQRYVREKSREKP